MRRLRSTHPLILAPSLAAAGLALGAACESDQDLVPVPPSSIDLDCGPGCLPEALSDWVNAGSASEVGSAVEIVSYGDGSSNLKEYRVAAAGGPEYSASTGIVYVHPADPGTGLLTGYAVALLAPTGAPTRFGATLLGVDIHEGFTQLEGSPPEAVAHAYGEELLVGAPGDGSQELGKLYWYTPTDAQNVFDYSGGHTPSGVSNGAEYGFAVAAPHYLDANYPSGTTTEVPDWIAVGAPGEDKVYILAVDPGRFASPRLSVITPVLSGTSGTRFGHSLAIADFDQDGYLDLAVGIPDGAGGEGAVKIYPGQSGSPPLDTSAGFTLGYDDMTGWPGPAGNAESFGTSLAAGFLYADDLEVPGLVVGDPDWDSDDFPDTDIGAICQIKFSSTWTYTDRCNEAPETFGDDARFGASVAVGNFIAQNAMGSEADACPRAEDIAVGAPGYTGGVHTAEGSVTVFTQDEDMDGVFIDNFPPRTFVGGDDDVHLGAAVAADFVQSGTNHEDLVMGAPGQDGDKGSFSVTRAVPVSGEDDLLSGTWQADDSAGDPFTVRANWTGTKLYLRMLEDARIKVTKADGTLCSLLGYSADFTGYLGLPGVDWTTNGDVDGGPEEVVIPLGGGIPDVYTFLSYDEGTEEFQLAFDESQGLLDAVRNAAGQGSCTVVGDPWVFTQIESVSCE